MKLLYDTACDFMVDEDYEIVLEFFLIAIIINLRTQDFSCSVIDHHVIISYYGFTETLLLYY